MEPNSKLVEIQFPVVDESDPHSAVCADLTVYSYLPRLLKDDILQAYPLLNEQLEFYPFTTDEQSIFGDQLKSRDEIRYEVGLILAKVGHYDKAKEQWNLIIDDSEWEPSAQKALSAINTSHDFFDLCLQVQNCPDYFYIDELVDFIPAAQYNNLISTFTQLGINILQSGTYDFYHDGENEPWILLDEGTDNYFYYYFTKDETQIIIHGSYYLYTINPPGELTITLTEETDEVYTYSLSVDGSSEEPQLMQVGKSANIKPSSYMAEYWNLFATEQEFFNSNTSLNDFVSQLTVIYDVTAGCEDDENFYCELRIENEYLLALAYELQGNDAEAVSRYYTIWTSYPDSPYAMMAAAKLSAR